MDGGGGFTRTRNDLFFEYVKQLSERGRADRIQGKSQLGLSKILWQKMNGPVRRHLGLASIMF